MSTLLRISASPKGDHSDGNALGDAFLAAYQEANADVTVDHIDLFDGTLPHFGRLAAEAKMSIFAGSQPNEEQQGEWQQAHEVFDRFAAADAYLFTVPMWNSGIPYPLKQYIDIITQPGWTLVVALSFFGLRTRHHAEAVRLSGMAQSVGYLVAATGPLGIGLVHDATGSWTLAIGVMLPILAVQLGAGVLAGRSRTI